MRRADYLQCRRGRWSVRLRVPTHLVATVGQTHLVRSLDTSDEVVARGRRWTALALLWDWIGAQTVSDRWEPSWAAALTGTGRSHDEGGREYRASTPHPPHKKPSRKVNPSQPSVHISAFPTTILTTMERWLIEIQEVQTKQSRMQHALAIREFARTQPIDLDVRKVDRRMAGQFVSEVLLKSSASQRTVNRKIASLSSMWQWLIKRGFVVENPWRGQGSFAYGRNLSQAKRAYTADELDMLLTADSVKLMGKRYGTVISDLMRVGLLTGCRISELCEMRLNDVLVEQQAVRIVVGKTENARRIIPVHKLIWPIVQQRYRTSDDGWLFSGLTPSGPDRKRSWIVVKRYSPFRQKVLGPSKQIDFHSFRRCFATYLERASTHTTSVNSSVIAELMGHTKPTLALSVYSSGLIPQQLRAAIDSLDLAIEPVIAKKIAAGCSYFCRTPA